MFPLVAQLLLKGASVKHFCHYLNRPGPPVFKVVYIIDGVHQAIKTVPLYIPITCRAKKNICLLTLIRIKGIYALF